MTTLRMALDLRREEFDAHFALAQALEERMLLELDASLGNVNLSARHINTIKSGLVVHLYNIEEAVMSQALNDLGVALGSVDPHRWTEHSLKEWLREAVASRIVHSNEDDRVATIYRQSNLLLTTPSLGPQKLKKPSGTWDNDVITTFANRMNVTLWFPPEMWRRVAPDPLYGDDTPLQFLAKRRNAIAHGLRSFENGASDLRLSDIRALADITLDYIGYVADAFHNHIRNNAHVRPAAV